MFRRRYAYADGAASNRAPVMGGGLVSLARVITTIGTIVAAIIVAGVILRVLDANASNDIVKVVLDGARWLVGPFRGLFSVDDADWQVVVNWGLAAVVYFAVARLIARLLMR
jgi:hypothetical protein